MNKKELQVKKSDAKIKYLQLGIIILIILIFAFVILKPTFKGKVIATYPPTDFTYSHTITVTPTTYSLDGGTPISCTICIQEAIDSITDASESNRYLIQVNAGTYIGQVNLKNYVSLRGAGKGQTIIQYDSTFTVKGVIVSADSSVISDLTIIGTTSAAGVTSLSGITAFYVENVEIDANSDTIYIINPGITVYANNIIASVYIDGISLFADSKIYIWNSQLNHINTQGLSSYVCSNGEMYIYDNILTAETTKNYNGIFAYNCYVEAHNLNVQVKDITSLPINIIYSKGTTKTSIINLYSGTITTTIQDTTGDTYDFKQEGLGILNVYGTIYSGATSGTINFFSISFVNPTPKNRAIQSKTNVEINTSVEKNNLKEIIFNWNSTDYSLYDNSLVLMLGLNNLSALGENNTRMIDVSEYSNNGSCSTNCPTFTPTGKFGGAYSFDGINDNITVPYSPSLQFINLTVSAWIKTIDTWGGIAHQYDGGGAGNFIFAIENPAGGRVRFGRACGGCYIDSNGIVNDNQWHHVVGVFDDTTNRVKIYIDGKEDRNVQDTNSLEQNSVPFIIGDENDGMFGFDGLIDEIKVWNRALSAQEINQSYMSNLYKYEPDKWILYVNQTRNPSTGLSAGKYTYNVSIKDNSDYILSTETRNLMIGCGNLNQENEVYYLEDDLSSTTTTCFNIIANNITLDCQGHKITHVNGHGIFVNGANNTIIKNCKVEKTQTAGGAVTSNIELDKSYNATILNNSLLADVGNTYNIYIYLGGSHQIINNTATSAVSGPRPSFTLYDTSNNKFSRNNVTISNNNNEMFFMNGGTNNSLNNENYVSTAATPIVQGFVIFNYGNLTVTNSYINVTSTAKSDMEISISSKVNFTNVTFDSSDLLTNAILNVHWWFDAYVQDQLGSSIQGAELKFYEEPAMNYLFSEYTNSEGKLRKALFHYKKTEFGIEEIRNLYSIKATKQGYSEESISINLQNGNSYQEFTIEPNVPPVIQSVDITPSTAYANSTLNCTFTVTDANTGDILTVNITWFIDDIRNTDYDVANLLINNGALSSTNITINQPLHDKQYICSVNANDGTAWSEWSNSSSILILNHSTSMIIETSNDNPLVDEVIYFYANYTKTDRFNIPGMGGEIGRINVNVSNLDPIVPQDPTQDDLYTVAFVDLDNDGKKNDFVVGTEYLPNTLFAFYANGTKKWNIQARTYEIEVTDLDNDGYENDIAIASLGTSGLKVYNEEGSLVWQSTGYNDFYSLAAGDIDNDGDVDIVGGNIYRQVVAYEADGTYLWSTTVGLDEIYEVHITDIDPISNQRKVVVGEDNGFYRVFNGLTGILSWATPDLGNSRGGIGIIDLDNDGKKNEFLFGTAWNSGNLYAYDNYGELWFISSGANGIIYDVAVADLDDDGYENDFIFSNDGTNQVYAYSGTTTGATLLWSYPTGYAYSITIADVNNDGEGEILVGSNTLYVFNRTGSLLWNYSVENYIGYKYGPRPGIDVSDNNNDGINDILVGSIYGSVYVFNDMPDCVASFDDGTNYNMIWNNTLREWQTNKSFSTEGTYSWSVTCEKDGYEPQIQNSQITVSTLNVAPQINFTDPTPANGTSQSATNVKINVSIVESNLKEMKFNWNTTNFTLYNESLVLMYNFNKLVDLGEFDTNIKDMSLYNSVGLATGATWTSSGKYNGAYSFDGVNNFISVTDTDVLDFTATNKYTFEMWIKPNTGWGTEGRGLMSKGIWNPTGGGYALYINSNGNFCAGDNREVATATCTLTTATPNQWQHVVYIYNNRDWDLYINGNYYNLATLGGMANSVSDSITIGKAKEDVSGNDIYFNGIIDEVRIWNRTLTAREINQSYMSNLYKYNLTQWYFYVNQTKNPSTGLSEGKYTYFAFAKNTDKENMTETREITILPPIEITSIEIKDKGATLQNPMTVTPIPNSRAEVDINATIKDINNQCESALVYAHLCNLTQYSTCSPIDYSGDYKVQLTTLNTGIYCNYSYSGTDKMPWFFDRAGTWKIYVNATNQGKWTANSIDFEYVGNAFLGYPYDESGNPLSSIALGKQSGQDIILEAWNTNTIDKYIAHNYGNVEITLQWKIDDPTCADPNPLYPGDYQCTSSIEDPVNHDNWSIAGNDFMIDDDISQSDDTGNLLAVYLTETETNFPPISTTLKVCTSDSCPNTDSYIYTYYHLYPPTSLNKPGPYSTTIYYTATKAT